MQNETLVNGLQDMSQKLINQVILIRFVGNPNVYQAPKGSCFIAACAIGEHEKLFTVQFINIFTSEFFEDYPCKTHEVVQ